MHNQIAIIGGGASGLVAAIVAARFGKDVTIYEKNSRLGKKILSTGNGRCNLSNKNASKSNYHGSDVDFMDGTISKFWVNETLAFFSELGLVLKTESDGKIYPYSNQAAAVLDVLRFEIDRLGINVVYDFEAATIKKTKNGYSFTSYDGKGGFAEKVIISTGGMAAPSTGSCGSGYKLCKMLGHSVTDIFPSLVQIKTKGGFVKSLKGIKTDALLSINNLSFKGELLFTDYGISGPPVFSLSSYLVHGRDKKIKFNFMPEYSEEQILDMLTVRAKREVDLENYFVGMLNKRLGMALLKECGITPLSRPAKSLTDEELKKLCCAICGLLLETDGTQSWNNAQVTAGGVELYGINSDTLESLYNEGLYFCGEILDIDGDCGGYNLQWAWSSGYIAGSNASESIKKEELKYG